MDPDYLDDEKYFGGNYWQMRSPLLHRYLISSAGAGRFVLVCNPDTKGAELMEQCCDGGDLFYTLEQLKELLKDAKHLGDFCDWIQESDLIEKG